MGLIDTLVLNQYLVQRSLSCILIPGQGRPFIPVLLTVHRARVHDFLQQIRSFLQAFRYLEGLPVGFELLGRYGSRQDARRERLGQDTSQSKLIRFARQLRRVLADLGMAQRPAVAFLVRCSPSKSAVTWQT